MPAEQEPARRPRRPRARARRAAASGAIPQRRDGEPSLADILVSASQAIRGESNALDLPPVSRAIVLLIDGLGSENLAQRSGHARTLAAAPGGAFDGGFPSTTAVSLATLATGVLPGAHGIVGYDAMVPGHGVRNQLRDWGGPMDPVAWQRTPTLFESTRSLVIAEPKHAKAGFTNAVLRGAEYRGGATMRERFEIAAGSDHALTYLYMPELDRYGHNHGWQSARWLDALEAVDACVREFAGMLGADAGLIVTADHGMVDVPHESQLVVPPSLLGSVAHVAGEPRCLQLHFDADTDVTAQAQRWREWASDAAWVATVAEVEASGWLGEVAPEVAPRLGDLFIAARDTYAFYTEEDAKARSMIGQHGSLTDAELRVPLLRFGAFA